MDKISGCHKILESHTKLESGIGSRRMNPNTGENSPLLFVIAMIPLNTILKKYIVHKKFTE